MADLSGRERPRGYFGIGIYAAKHEANIGSLWRVANCYRANFIFTIGKRYRVQKSDTMKTWKHIPCWEFEKFADFLSAKPKECTLVGVELHKQAHSLKNYVHPEKALYLLGAEDFGLPDNVLAQCDNWLQIPSLTQESLNVATAGSIIVWDRFIKY